MTHGAAISRVHAREVLDSRGNPTVEVEVYCQGGAHGRAIVPSGASTGRFEAVELRDGDPARFGGKGVRRAVSHVNDTLGPKIDGISVMDQSRIDQTLRDLDGTPNKSKLGANALLAVSLACASARASFENIPLWRSLSKNRNAHLPMPMVNMISGGLHAGGNLDFQDFLLIPVGARSYSEALEMTVKVYRSLANVLAEAGHESVLVGDEGGFGPRLRSNDEAVEVLVTAIERANFNPGKQAAIALDVASSHFYHDGRYVLKATGGKPLTSSELIDWLERLVERFPIVSIEDGMAEDDWEGWRQLTQRLGTRVQLIGDDLFATNPARLRQGFEAGVANSVLVKVNQIGTLSETLDVVNLAQEHGYRTVISARSGESEDSFIADLSVATGAGQIKIGSVARSERLAKYNQLLRIEEMMSQDANFAGRAPRPPVKNGRRTSG